MILPAGAGGGRWAENEARAAKALAKLSPDEFEVALRKQRRTQVVIFTVIVAAFSALGLLAMWGL